MNLTSAAVPGLIVIAIIVSFFIYLASLVLLMKSDKSHERHFHLSNGMLWLDKTKAGPDLVRKYHFRRDVWLIVLAAELIAFVITREMFSSK